MYTVGLSVAAQTATVDPWGDAGRCTRYFVADWLLPLVVSFLVVCLVLGGDMLPSATGYLLWLFGLWTCTCCPSMNKPPTFSYAIKKKKNYIKSHLSEFTYYMMRWSATRRLVYQHHSPAGINLPLNSLMYDQNYKEW